MSDAMFWLSAGEATVFPAKFLAGYLVMFQCSQPTRAPLFNTLFVQFPSSFLLYIPT
jgi:hypothetical protein